MHDNLFVIVKIEMNIENSLSVLYLIKSKKSIYFAQKIFPNKYLKIVFD
jgi:hypothetical protein